MRNQKFLFYSLAALLAVLVFMVYYDMIFFQASDIFRPWYYDIVEHFIGGGIVGGLFLYYSYSLSRQNFPKNFLLTILMAASFVALVAVVWEVYEFYTNIWGHAIQNTLSDTLSDMVTGILGASVSAFLIRWKFIAA